MTNLQRRYEAETGQSAMECIDVSKMDHRVLTRANEDFLQWADRIAIGQDKEKGGHHADSSQT